MIGEMSLNEPTTPLWRALNQYKSKGYARFHMPGHKGECFPPFGDIISYDLTEVEGTDSLFEATGAIAELEEIFTNLYGTRRTVISTGGSTSCIQAMLKLVATPGKKLVAGRNIHVAAVNAMALLGMEPAWVYPDRRNERLIGQISPEAVEEALNGEGEACGVYITSPDYFGVMSDIAGIAEVCKSHEVPLLVDNAHGAHLKFLQGGLHPMNLGATLCCDSLHKTLPALTGAALLHTSSPLYADKLKEAMAVFASTSPSYLIMLSCDTTAAFLLGDGPGKMEAASMKCRNLMEIARKRGFYPVGGLAPMRVTLPLAGTGFSGEAFRVLLREHGIMEEFVNDTACVLLASSFNSPESFMRVERLLMNVEPAKGGFEAFPMFKPERAVSLREALMAKSERIPVEESNGRTSARVQSPCPPGIPLIMPGESLHKDYINVLKRYGIYRLDVLK